MKNNLDKADLMEIITERVDQMFTDIHKTVGTGSGDITPLQSEQLEEIKERLCSLVFEQVTQNL